MLILAQIARQTAKGHQFLFTSSTGSPLDMNVYRRRKLHTLRASLEISEGAFHAFRHFNASLLDAVGATPRVIKERIGHASTGCFTLDVYGSKPEWKANQDAAQKLGAAIDEAVRKAEQDAEAQAESFDRLTAGNENGSQGASL